MKAGAPLQPPHHSGLINLPFVRPMGSGEFFWKRREGALASIGDNGSTEARNLPRFKVYRSIGIQLVTNPGSEAQHWKRLPFP